MKKGILLAAFGSGSPQGESALREMELRVRERFPGMSIRWAFTSPVMRERLAGQWKKSDSVEKALQKMLFERIPRVAVQPLHVVPGVEYGEVVQEARSVSEGFTAFRMGLPLLDDGADLDPVAQAILDILPPQRQPDEPVLFMGHGSRHPSEARYTALADAVNRRDKGVFMGTMKGTVQLDQLLPRLDSLTDSGGSALGLHRPCRVWLMPFLSIVGRHALEDMAGNGPESWRSRLLAAGYTCEPVLRGLVEYAPFAELWIHRLASAVSALESDA